LKNVFAEITLKNSSKIFIYSDQAKYNKSNLNTHFFENVKLNYEDYNIKSENIFLDYVTKEVKIAENVVYNDSNNKLNADAIDMDLITKFSKIYMINKDNKITAIIKN
jgi:Organic solvent tolerance protein OstA